MNKQEMLKEIYEKIADKTLNFGCRVEVILRRYDKNKNDVGNIGTKIGKILDNGNDCYLGGSNIQILDNIKDVDFWRELEDCQDFNNTNILYYLGKIIGHPIYIGRCDLLIKKGPNYFDNWIPILDLRIDKNKPIDEQTIEVIEYIYNLIYTL